MKRIFTLLLATGFVSMVQAQPGQRNKQDRMDDRQPTKVVVVTNDRYDNDRFDNDRYFDNRISLERKRDREVTRINREYDYKIQKVRNSFFFNRFEKMRQIRQLEDQRQWELRKTYERFNKYKKQYYDRDDRYSRNERHDRHEW